MRREVEGGGGPLGADGIFALPKSSRLFHRSSTNYEKQVDGWTPALVVPCGFFFLRFFYFVLQKKNNFLMFFRQKNILAFLGCFFFRTKSGSTQIERVDGWVKHHTDASETLLRRSWAKKRPVQVMFLSMFIEHT